MKINRIKVTQAELHELLSYDKGKLYWRSSGIQAGSHEKGYLRISVNGQRYQAHRLVWLYCKGWDSENILDHTDQDKLNNNIDNLKEVSFACNMHNASKLQANNTSGVNGLTWDKLRKRWSATIHDVSEGIVRLGRHADKWHAAFARYYAEIKYGYTTCQTYSSAENYCIENLINTKKL